MENQQVFEVVRFLMETTQATQSVANDGFPIVVSFLILPVGLTHYIRD